MSEMIDPFIKALDQVEQTGPAWLDALRKQGAQDYRTLALPHVKLEQWKYTNLKDLRGAEIAAADAALLDALPATLPDLDAYRLVLVNGRFDADLSDLGGLSDKALVKGLEQALEDGDIETLGGGFEDAALVSLSDALLRDGAFIRIKRGHMLDKPIHLVILSVGSDKLTASHPRIVIDMQDGASATVIETHMGANDSAVVSLPVSEVTVAEKARLGHYKQQLDNAQSYHLAHSAVTVAEGATYDSFVLQLGGKLARCDVRCLIDGAHADVRVNGAYHAGNGQHVDNTSFIDHAAPDAKSAENFRGVLDGDGRGVFQGKILVRQIAQGTDGQQMNRALLLSEKAEIDSKPELEIYADDVKCSHGATAGDMDEDQLFYLMARGIDADTARKLLIQAFLFDVLNEIDYAPAREIFHDAIAAKLGEIA
ncbi:Fe-S cluster assembly protein SufD [Aestuariispira insulae]|uniref:Fe-S cluster assembly protein SufD n=1 Tax=Aestuariispira insulae TaxID=1461337 RepID=A0A3D9HSA3_9PROT|nr:Fe-S cluster assembly protein SufD [Aestuariispira insulae]RED52339.1 Fe-S cluster assembly protein SufD [Aestuariispira insulae]